MLKNKCSLFLMYDFHLPQLGFQSLGLGEGVKWMVLQRMLNTCKTHMGLT